MKKIKFGKEELTNLEYSLSREILNSNRLGSYYSTTVILCNTRKYHGLLVTPLPELDGENHVLLSSVDETIIQQGEHFHLGIHKYPGTYNPKGHKYIDQFELDTHPVITYQVGGIKLIKEIVLAEKKECVYIKYTLVNSKAPVTIKLRPYMAFRKVHSLTKANNEINKKIENVSNGIKTNLYSGYPDLYLQLSKNADFVQVPDWYYNVEYLQEQDRGYDYTEDLYVPGYFEFNMKEGESIIFAAGTTGSNTKSLKQQFESEITKKLPLNTYENCLMNAARQFIVEKIGRIEIIAGYPWFGAWGRDTFISLPGLTLALKDPDTCKDVLDSMSKQMKKGLFPNVGSDENAAFNSVDAPLWYFWAIQQYADYILDYTKIWKEYGQKMKNVLDGFVEGQNYNIKMHDNGLIYGGEEGKALTWMDAIANGKPVTPRIGYDVEINALWYNAVMFSLQLASQNKDKDFIEKWKDLPDKIRKSFVETFWDEKKQYLADYVNYDYKDWSVRPNQIFAASLPFSPINDDMKRSVIEKVQKELLTPKGLRTLSPKHTDYIGVYQGDQLTRDSAYHQGTVWPWLLGHFCEAYLNLYQKSGLSFVKQIYNGFEDEMTRQGLGTIPEIFDGNPPHHPKGAISQAWSIAELIRIKSLIENYN